jgi:hypothetical protein
LPKNSESPPQGYSTFGEEFVRLGEPFHERLTISSGFVGLQPTLNAPVVTVRAGCAACAPGLTEARAG